MWTSETWPSGYREDPPLYWVLGTHFLSSFCHSLGGVHSTTDLVVVPSPSSASSCLLSTLLSSGSGMCYRYPSLHRREGSSALQCILGDQGSSAPQCILGDHEVLMFGCQSLVWFLPGDVQASTKSPLGTASHLMGYSVRP